MRWMEETEGQVKYVKIVRQNLQKDVQKVVVYDVLKEKR